MFYPLSLCRNRGGKAFFFFKETEGACILLCLLLGGKRGGVRSCGHLCMGAGKEGTEDGGKNVVIPMTTAF